MGGENSFSSNPAPSVSTKKETVEFQRELKEARCYPLMKLFKWMTKPGAAAVDLRILGETIFNC